MAKNGWQQPVVAYMNWKTNEINLNGGSSFFLYDCVCTPIQIKRLAFQLNWTYHLRKKPSVHHQAQAHVRTWTMVDESISAKITAVPLTKVTANDPTTINQDDLSPGLPHTFILDREWHDPWESGAIDDEFSISSSQPINIVCWDTVQTDSKWMTTPSKHC